MGLLGAYIKSKDIDVEIIDSEVEGVLINGLLDGVEREKPLLLGIVCTGANPSSSTMIMAGIVDFFQEFNKRSPGVKTFIWGPHPTVLPERTLREPDADFVIRGEGYQTIVELFNTLRTDPSNVDKIAGLSYLRNARYTENKDVPLIKDLDILPMIDWDAMHPSKYRAHNWHCFGDVNNRTPYAIVWTSFGCPYKCNFCCINNLFGKRTQRFRSIDSVIREISILVEKHNIRHLKILDELFVTHPKRIEEFCDKLEEKNYDLHMWSFARADTINRHLLKRLKKVGMDWISYGFESTNPKILKDISKGYSCNFDEVIKMTQDEGIYICADVMFGMWEDDMDTLKSTYDFLVKHNFEWVNMYPVFAYPGTELYERIEEPKSWKVYALYGYECIPAGTKYLSPKEVLKFRDEAFVKYHNREEYLKMMENKFGSETKEHIVRMLKISLRRRLLEEK